MGHVSDQFHIDIQSLQGSGVSPNTPASAGADRHIIQKYVWVSGLDDIECLHDIFQFAQYTYLQGNAVEALFLPGGQDLGAHHLRIFCHDNAFYETLKLGSRQCCAAAFQVLRVGCLPAFELLILRLQCFAYGGGALQLLQAAFQAGNGILVVLVRQQDRLNG